MFKHRSISAFFPSEIRRYFIPASFRPFFPVPLGICYFTFADDIDALDTATVSLKNRSCSALVMINHFCAVHLVWTVKSKLGKLSVGDRHRGKGNPELLWEKGLGRY